ncbi:MAG: hypothetical protein WCC22_10280 [Terriglobales bacterium]
MFYRLCGTALLVCLAAACSQAQNPTKVEPTHYKLDFENDHVQVVSVHYGPHERSVMHDHPGGVVVVITGGHLKFTDNHGKIQEVFAKPGEARWFAPFKHRVENLGDTAYNAVYVGIKTKPARDEANAIPPALDEETLKILARYLPTAAAQK